MGKKKSKIAKLTEEQYLAYIAGLKNDTSFDGNRNLPVPSKDSDDEKTDKKD